MAKLWRSNFNNLWHTTIHGFSINTVSLYSNGLYLPGYGLCNFDGKCAKCTQEVINYILDNRFSIINQPLILTVLTLKYLILVYKNHTGCFI